MVVLDYGVIFMLSMVCSYIYGKTFIKGNAYKCYIHQNGYMRSKKRIVIPPNEQRRRGAWMI